MATEAEIITEPRTVLKADEEITKPISESKKPEGGLNEEITSEGDEKMLKIEAIADHDPTLEEKRDGIEEEISHNAIESEKQEGNLELKKQDSITNPDPIIDSSNEANEIVKEAGFSGFVQEKNLEEIKDTESEKLPALEGKAEGTEATEDVLTSKTAETSGIKDHETISDITEVAEKELQNGNPHEETACVHEDVSKEPEPDQHPIADISNTSISTKEEESIPLELTEKASSSVELEDSKKDTADMEYAPATDETEEKSQETNKPEVNEVEETKAVPAEVKKPEETKAVPTATLPSKDEGIETAHSTEKVEEEIHKDAEIVKHESAIEEACLQKEEESEPKAVSLEETIADEGLQNEEHEPKQTGAAQALITEESKEIETTQAEEAVVEAPQDEIIEKQMVSEDKSVQNPSQASSIMPIVEESNLESSQTKPEGTKASDNQKDDANNNVEEEIVAQEQPQVSTKESTIVPVEEAKPEAASATSGNISLSDLLQRSEEEKIEVAERVIEESELTASKEAAAPVEDAENIQAKEAKTDEQKKTDSGSDAPVMVEASRDTETKPHKKSQNIVSKAISKVKKAITGKSSSNSKEPKATSPNGGEK